MGLSDQEALAALVISNPIVAGLLRVVSDHHQALEVQDRDPLVDQAVVLRQAQKAEVLEVDPSTS